MKLHTALTLFIWGVNHSFGNAFAAKYSTPVAFHKDSSLSSSPFLIKGTSRGGDLSPTTLSVTVGDVEVCPEAVAKYVSNDNWSLLSARGKQALSNLINGDEGIGAQGHVYKDWPEAGTEDEGKVKLAEQVSYVKVSHIFSMIRTKRELTIDIISSFLKS